jgi:hypothetical protein
VASERTEHRAVDGPQVGDPTALARLDMARAARHCPPNLHGFGKIIIMKKADAASAGDDLDFLGRLHLSRIA